MLIRFTCENCRARLSVSSRKAGSRATCPKCQQPLVVPVPADSEAPPAEAPPVEAPPAIDSEGVVREDPFAQFVVYDDPVELVYDVQEDAPVAEPSLSRVDPNKLAVPRYVLYTQGALLGVVAIVCFALGVLVGQGSAGRRSVVDSQPTPCLIRGTVAVAARGQTTLPDEGAVAIVVPRDLRPDSKIDMEALLPSSLLPADDDPQLRALRSIGGDYARTDNQGNFELRVPDIGEYFVLVISANRARTVEEQSKTVLAQIGRFFQLDPDMFGGNDYRWQTETVRRDRFLTFVF